MALIWSSNALITYTLGTESSSGCTVANKTDHAVLALSHNLAGKIYVKQMRIL